MHSPVNHPLRPVYRALGVLAGLYLVVFGIVGFFATSGDDLLAVGGESGHVLGQGTNLAWSIGSLIAGVVVLAASAIGRNLDVAVHSYVGWTVIVIATAMLALIRTDANILNFSIFTVVVTYLVALVLITVSLYSKVVAEPAASTPRRAREHEAA